MSESLTISYKYTSNNFWIVNSEINPNQAIVLHGTAGGFQGSLNELLNGGGSSNYLIAKNGDVYCLVDPYKNRRAWGNGIWQYPDITNQLIQSWYNRGINPNLRTISIEHEQSSQDMTNKNYSAFNAKQALASKRLVLKLCKDFNIPISRVAILGHFQFMRYDRAYCPGVIDISKYVDGVKVMANGEQNESQFFPETGFTVSDSQNGEYTGFLKYWKKVGLSQLGYPIGNAFYSSEHKRIVQWFERARLEQHKENARTEYEVQEGLLGREILDLQRELARQISLNGYAANNAQTSVDVPVETNVIGNALSEWTKLGAIKITNGKTSDGLDVENL